VYHYFVIGARKNASSFEMICIITDEYLLALIKSFVLKQHLALKYWLLTGATPYFAVH